MQQHHSALFLGLALFSTLASAILPPFPYADPYSKNVPYFSVCGRPFVDSLSYQPVTLSAVQLQNNTDGVFFDDDEIDGGAIGTPLIFVPYLPGDPQNGGTGPFLTFNLGTIGNIVSILIYTLSVSHYNMYHSPLQAFFFPLNPFLLQMSGSFGFATTLVDCNDAAVGNFDISVAHGVMVGSCQAAYL